MKVSARVEFGYSVYRSNTVILTMGASFEIVGRRGPLGVPLELDALLSVESESGEVAVVGMVEDRVFAGLGWKKVL